MKEDMLDFVDTIEDKLITYRRDFHKYPESGWTEFRTSSIIAGILNALGYRVHIGKDILDPKYVMGRDTDIIASNIKRAIEQGGDKDLIDRMKGYTGVVADINTGITGPTIALRFDIDANDVIEATEDGHRPFEQGFASVNKGVMHACGHDGHIAIGLGLAETLAKFKSSLKGTIRFIFQPAEEGVRGARAIVEKGILDNVDYFLSGHIGFNVPTGSIVPRAEGFLATTKIDAMFKGKGAHAGAAPQEGNNALLAAANALINIHSIPPHSGGITRVNVGTLNGGVGRNVVPPIASMKIETRGEDSELNRYVLDKTIKIIEHSGEMYDCKTEISKMGESVTVKCDLSLGEFIKREILKISATTNIIENKSLGGSEDVTFMIERVRSRGGKASYLIFGSNTAAGHHNEKFDFDETVLSQAVKIYSHLILSLLNDKR